MVLVAKCKDFERLMNVMNLPHVHDQ